MPRLSYLILLILLSYSSAALVRAQGAGDAQAQLARQGRVFDLSNEEKKRETVSAFVNAAGNGEQKIVELYLAAGMDINVRDEFEQTALFMATVERKYALALMLLGRGADPNLARDDKLTPLPVAIQRGFNSSRIVREDKSAQLIKALLDRGANVNALDEQSETPLMEAATLGDVETMTALITRGADVTHRNSAGQTAFDIAVSERRGVAVQALIDSGSPLTLRQKIQYYCYKFARLQGWTLPFLIAFSFLVGYFGKKLTKPQPKRNAVDNGDELPHLAPLKCERCGAGVPLKADHMQCPRCDNSIPVPEDYAATVRLRAKATEQMAKAVAAWRHAHLFTVWPIRWTLWLLAPVWLVATGIGLFSNLGNSLFAINTAVAFLALFAMLGGLSLAVAFWAYAIYLNGTRQRLPVIPVVGQQVGEAEVTGCHLCGGGISYADGDLAAICGYCGGETYRVKLARRARAVATEEKEQATLSLYDAMTEIVARRQKAFKYLSSTATGVFILAALILIYVVV